MPSMSRTLRCFAAASMRERADHAGVLAERDRQRRIGAAAADQQHGGVARRIDMRQRHRRCRHQPAHHGRMQRAHAQRGAQARHQAVGAGRRLRGLALKERNDVVRMRESADRPRSAADRAGAPRRARPAAASPAASASDGRGQHGGRLHLFDGARRVRPLGLDHRKQPRDIERGGKRRPSRGRYDEDRALLGHLDNSDQARIWNRAILVCRRLMRRQRRARRRLSGGVGPVAKCFDHQRVKAEFRQRVAGAGIVRARGRRAGGR